MSYMRWGCPLRDGRTSDWYVFWNCSSQGDEPERQVLSVWHKNMDEGLADLKLPEVKELLELDDDKAARVLLIYDGELTQRDLMEGLCREWIDDVESGRPGR